MTVDVYFHTVLFPAVQMADGEKWTMLHNLSSTRAYPLLFGWFISNDA